jgi:hypothetical protein
MFEHRIKPTDMKQSFRLLLVICMLFSPCVGIAQLATVTSPDQLLTLEVWLANSKPAYTVKYKSVTMLEKSPLGLTTSIGDFTNSMKYLNKMEGKVDKHYTQDRIKKSNIHYLANQLTCTFANGQNQAINVVFQVSNNDIAFRYEISTWKDRFSCVVTKESTGYRFPMGTTTFLSANMLPMTGFARTAPSYESSYHADAAMDKSSNREGYIFPSLFRVGKSGWVLLSETGVSSKYCAAHLSNYKDSLYTVEYPNIAQNNGFGSTGAALALPGVTPWRTITVGENLKPIVETTIPFDVVEPLYAASQPYRFGKATWSWILWQDGSMNYDDQVKYIDLAAALKYEYVLMDALWDTNIGKPKMETLVKYAQSKNVDVFLWYNSNGAANDAPQGPRSKMSTAIDRKKEMRWLQKIGVKGLKVDFFGGDKQETIRLYEDILSDANDYGLMIDFHGATLPRGWERMYPNFVGSEAVLASEMLIFSQDVRNNEAFNATMHPFIRNTVGSMEFGGVLLNNFLVKSNKNDNKRLTTAAFQLATAVLFQNPVQMFALAPNNLTDVPSFQIDFMKAVPTTWDETLFLDGYPGQYVVLARRSGDQWYVCGVNAQNKALKLKIALPMFAGKNVKMYNDDQSGVTDQKELNIGKNGAIALEIQPNGGVVLHQSK